jgi:hypothetical protein
MSTTGMDISRIMYDTLGEEEWARMFARDGMARQTEWECGDGWIVGYTTGRIRHGGENAGKFAAFAYKPIGKGSRSGTALNFKRVYFRTFKTRKSARKRAEALYYQHAK